MAGCPAGDCHVVWVYAVLYAAIHLNVNALRDYPEQRSDMTTH